MIGLAIKLSLLRLRRACFPFVCQAMAVTAVMVPVLIILGLKSGIISSMREGLMADPSSLEIRQSDGIDLTTELCEEIRQWPETGFIIPRTSLLASTITVGGVAENAPRERLDLLPSAEGDPVMERGGVQAPKEGEIVLSHRAAASLNLKAGDEVLVTVWRNARKEKLEEKKRLSAILPEKVERRSIVYMPLEAAVRVEDFISEGREGAGASALVSGPVYDAIVLRGTGAGEMAGLLQKNNEALKAQRGGEGNYADLPKEVWVAGGNGTRITAEEANGLIELANRHRVEAAVWNPPMHAVLLQTGETPVTVRCESSMNGSCGTCKTPPVLAVHKAEQAEGTVLIPCKKGTSRLVCQLQEREDVPEGEVWASPQLMGMFHMFSLTCMEWDYRESLPRRPVLSFVAMRLYAKDLESAEPLYGKLRGRGYPCHAKLGVIRQLLSLERALDILFLLISSCAALGAAVSMAMGLFNATERSLKDYAQLQIIGIPRVAQGLFPLVEALAVTLFSFVISMVVFFCSASVLGLLFENTVSGHDICSLSFLQAAAFLGVSLGLAFLSSIASSIRIFFINPAETIRQ